MYHDPDAAGVRQMGRLVGGRNSRAASKLKREARQQQSPEALRALQVRTVLGIESGTLSPEVGRSILYATGQIGYSPRSQKQKQTDLKQFVADLRATCVDLIAAGVPVTLSYLVEEYHAEVRKRLIGLDAMADDFVDAWLTATARLELVERVRPMFRHQRSIGPHDLTDAQSDFEPFEPHPLSNGTCVVWEGRQTPPDQPDAA